MLVDRYDPKSIEEKWQGFWEESNAFDTVINRQKTRILCFGNVSISIWKFAYGSRAQLFNW